MKNKKIIRALFLSFLGICLSSCQTAEKLNVQESQMEENVTLIVYYDNIKNFEYTDKIVNSFNRNSATTTVSVKYIIDGIYDETIRMTLLAGDDSVDCFSIGQASRSNALATAGLLTELGDYVRTTQLNIGNYGSAIDVVRLKDALYSLPISKNAWMLFYNKDYFDKMEVPYPQQMTWDEYADLAQQLTYVEKGKTYWGGFLPPWVMNLGAAGAEEYLTDDELPITERYVNILNRVYNVDRSHPDLFTMWGDYGEPYDLMEKGRVAMMVNADWGIGRLQSDAKQKPLGFEWDIAPLPIFEFMEEGTTVGSCNYLGISAFSSYTQNAFEFAAYLCGKEGAMIMAENAACPAYLIEDSMETYLEHVNVAGARYFFAENTYNQENVHPKYGEVAETFQYEMNYFLRGYKSFEQSFEDFDKSRAEILQQNS